MCLGNCRARSLLFDVEAQKYMRCAVLASRELRTASNAAPPFRAILGRGSFWGTSIHAAAAFFARVCTKEFVFFWRSAFVDVARAQSSPLGYGPSALRRDGESTKEISVDSRRSAVLGGLGATIGVCFLRLPIVRITLYLRSLGGISVNFVATRIVARPTIFFFFVRLARGYTIQRQYICSRSCGR